MFLIAFIYQIGFNCLVKSCFIACLPAPPHQVSPHFKLFLKQQPSGRRPNIPAATGLSVSQWRSRCAPMFTLAGLQRSRLETLSLSSLWVRLCMEKRSSSQWKHTQIRSETCRYTLWYRAALSPLPDTQRGSTDWCADGCGKSRGEVN